MSNLTTLTTTLANTLGMPDGGELIQTLKATAFKGQVSDAQMTALLVVANQYGLNPWTKEIYAFPDKNNGIVPVVGVDGWARIINSHPQFDGMEFEQGPESCTCQIYRKDRSRPVSVTEFMSECSRNTGPWQSHPRRMLRHKAMIQAARLAFGYSGIYDQDEAERIVEKEINPLPERKPAQAESMRRRMEQAGAVAAPTYERLQNVADAMNASQSMADLRACAEMAQRLSPADQETARAVYQARRTELEEEARGRTIDMETGEIAPEAAEFFGEGAA